MSENNLGDYMRAGAAARLAGCSVRTLERKARAGQVRSVRPLGGWIRYFWPDLLRRQAGLFEKKEKTRKP